MSPHWKGFVNNCHISVKNYDRKMFEFACHLVVVSEITLQSITTWKEKCEMEIITISVLQEAAYSSLIEAKEILTS